MACEQPGPSENPGLALYPLSQISETYAYIHLFLFKNILLILCLCEFVHDHKISIALYSPGLGRNTVSLVPVSWTCQT